MVSADLSSRLSQHQITIQPDFLSGKMQREGSQWLRAREWQHNGKTYQMVRFGDWKSNSDETWKSWGEGASDPEFDAEIEKKIRQENAERRRAKHEFQETQAIKLWDEWQRFTSGRSPYLDKKGIGELFGAAIDGTDLIIPMVDIDQKFWNFQRVTLDFKGFQKGARINGCFHVLEGHLEEASEIYIAEGFATAASVALALRSEGTQRGDPASRAKDRSVVCAFNASNLGVVSKAIHERFPEARITLAGDNDAFTVINGTKSNTGILAGSEAALSVKGRLCYPVFKEPKVGQTDWNDLHQAEGLGAVTDQLLQESFNLSPETENDSQVDEEKKGIPDWEPPPPNSEPRPETEEPKQEKPKKAGPRRIKYEVFEQFFQKQLGKARRDIVSGRLVEFDGMQWQSVIAQLGALRSHAIDRGLPDSKVKDHLERFIGERPKELLIDEPKWDGLDRIAGLKEFIVLKEPFEIFEDAFKEWGANIFRRLYENGAQNRCIILKGDQGIGKDFLIRSMLGSLGPYYAKFTNSRDDREIWDQVTGRLVIHIEEFEQTGSMTIAFLKDLITRDWATYRSAFGHDALTRRCVGSFISTANIDAPLRDSTGNRRFAVFEVDKIKWGYPQDWGTQIIAQFKVLWSENYRAKDATWGAISTSNNRFEVVDMVPEILTQWDKMLSNQFHNGSAAGIVELTFDEISEVACALGKQFGISIQKLLTIVKSSGRSRKGNVGTRYWSNLINTHGDARASQGGAHDSAHGVSH